MEAEVVRMVCHMFNGDQNTCGTVRHFFNRIGSVLSISEIERSIEIQYERTQGDTDRFRRDLKTHF